MACGGAATVADVFGASPELHRWAVLSLFSLMSALGEKNPHLLWGSEYEQMNFIKISWRNNQSVI